MRKKRSNAKLIAAVEDGIGALNPRTRRLPDHMIPTVSARFEVLRKAALDGDRKIVAMVWKLLKLETETEELLREIYLSNDMPKEGDFLC